MSAAVYCAPASIQSGLEEMPIGSNTPVLMEDNSLKGSVTWASVSGDELQSPTRPEASQTAPARNFHNIGSKGHPLVCARPCLYFPMGTCTNGDACSFCHELHSKRPLHLDKRHRMQLRALAPTQRLVLLMSTITPQVHRLDSSQLAVDLLDKVAVAAGLAASNSAENMQPLSHKARSLRPSLQGMTLRMLLHMLLREFVPTEEKGEQHDGLDGADLVTDTAAKHPVAQAVHFLIEHCSQFIEHQREQEEEQQQQQQQQHEPIRSL